MATILLVEDDERISEPLLRVLSTEGFDVIHAPTGNAGLDAVATGKPNLVLLDLTLPDIDGLDVCRRIRDDRPELPVIMLTARAEEMDVIVGLGAGADDYVPKPFRLAELVARIRARMRVAEAAHQMPRELSRRTAPGQHRIAPRLPQRHRARAHVEGVRSPGVADEPPRRHVHTRADHGVGVGRELLGLDAHARHAHLDACAARSATTPIRRS